MADDDSREGWSGLWEDLLCMIGQRLLTLDDVIRTRAVCKPWRRALRGEQHLRFPPSTHWLMLPYCTSNNMNMTTPISSSSTSCSPPMAVVPVVGCRGSENCRCFYDAGLHLFHHIEFPPGLRNKSCRGSTMGWLCMVGATAGISLWNPITRTEVSLPPLTSFPDVLAYSPENVRLEYLLREPNCEGYTVSMGKKSVERRYITRVAISTEPTRKECVVMAIRCHTDHRLAFCRPAEIEMGWIFVPHKEEDGIPPRGFAYADVIFWRDRFYSLDFEGNVLVCDFTANPHQPTLSYFVNLPPHRSMCADALYLVVSPAVVTGGDDELMMVARRANCFFLEEYHIAAGGGFHIDAPDSDSDDEQLDTGAAGGEAVAGKRYWTEKFQVFKLNKGTEGWDEVESIGDFALFLGFNTPSTLVSTKDHPGLMPNSIYFTDNLVDDHNHPQCKNRRHYDMGIYDLATGTIQPLYPTTSLHNNPLRILPLPIWLSPSSSLV